MPFDFLKRKKVDGAGKAPARRSAGAGSPPSGRGVPFDGLTEEWRIVGNMEVSGRLSDALNKREVDRRSRTSSGRRSTAPSALAPAPGLKAVDPYDLIIVLASETTLPPLNDEERTAHACTRCRTTSPWRCRRSASSERYSFTPARSRSGSSIGRPRCSCRSSRRRHTLTGKPVAPEMDAILVNRFYLRGIEQVDRRTGERHQKLPGAPLGGVSWQDRSR